MYRARKVSPTSLNIQMSRWLPFLLEPVQLLVSVAFELVSDSLCLVLCQMLADEKDVPVVVGAPNRPESRFVPLVASLVLWRRVHRAARWTGQVRLARDPLKA